MHVGPRHPRTARIALAIALLAAAWAIFLRVWGGFDAKVLGLSVTAHEPLRPTLIALVAVVAFAVANGLGRTLRRIRDTLGSAGRAIAGVDDRLIVGVIAAAVLAAAVHWGSKSAGGSDSYGYLSEMDLLFSGRVAASQPWIRLVPWPHAEWTFCPLGYHVGMDPTILLPTYPPGFSMMMAGAKLVAGYCAAFWIVPLSGAVFVLATFGVARRLGSSRLGLVAAWLVATSPVFLYMVMSPMSDVPNAAAWTVVFWCLLGESLGSAVGAAVALAVAMLIRPNLAPAAGVVALWLTVRAWRGEDGLRRRGWRRAAIFLSGLAFAGAAIGALNWYWNGSPLQTSYGGMAGIFAWSNVPQNVRNYSVWFVDTQTPLAVLGIVALLWPAKWLWGREVRRSAVVGFAAFLLVVWVEYCFYTTFDAWWYLRFFLPCWPFVMIGLGAVTLRLPRFRMPLMTVVVVIAVLALGVHGVRLAQQRRAFDMRWGDSTFPSAARVVKDVTEPNSVILSMQHSGSVRYYAGRLTMRYDDIDVDWLDRAIAWLAERGVHPYALLEDWEIREFARRFPGQRTIDLLKVPLRVYNGPRKVYLFDLISAPAASVVETFTDLDCALPAPVQTPALALKQP